MTRAVGPCPAEQGTGGLELELRRRGYSAPRYLSGNRGEKDGWKGTVMDTLIEHGGTDLGRRVLEYRHRAGLSCEEAAARAGTTASYLKYLETSRSPNPAASALARLADALGSAPVRWPAPRC
jgi:ribosome-binding protein aMBF1 (putative translation factor)